MKKILVVAGAVFLLSAFCADAQSKTKIDYMLENGVFKALEYAKSKSKPSMLYFNSVECHGCEMFSSLVMSDQEVGEYMKSTYVSINANIEKGDARRISSRYKAFNLPAVVLLSPDQEFSYTCNLKLDKKVLLDQTKNFFNAVALRDQIVLLVRTKHVSEEEAQIEIGESYARIDFRKNPAANPAITFEARALGMKYFQKCGEAYFYEWDEQKIKAREKDRK